MPNERGGLPPLYWDSSYAIALAVMNTYPEVDVEKIGIHELFELIIALPNFSDDPEMVNDSILNDILREWYEEVSR